MYVSCYDDSFDEEQFAIYNYVATYRNVKSLFNKYRMFKKRFPKNTESLEILLEI